MTPYIYAIETGLSSDPLMNRSLSALDRVMLISNSDAHSPRNFGREANVFEIDAKDFSYDTFIKILRERDTKRFLYTIEFFPEEGKYHFDGHAPCLFSCEPSETKRLGGMCRTCGKAITVGVLSRVADLSDREGGMMPDGHVPFKSIVPLEQIIAESLGLTGKGKRVQALYESLVTGVGNEFHILLDAPLSEIQSVGTPAIAEAIRRVREGKMHITPGYDGIYGVVQIFSENDPPPLAKQSTLV